ncbi:MAG: hypothetical protein H7A49_08430 [Akkermansiaceae bacterium]|nr:hypothetical protein [Akkermansiaceae bacterium]MCP5543918.1 hypothetical protein [Akkermansiaceae bacterium]MCP5547550.1 hypothetical protein [Akkermansiaceae bacterium]
MESEQLQNFNERLSQWVANQGFWFQVRYSMSGSGMKGRAMFHLLRMGFRLLIFLALVALGTWIYLERRTNTERFRTGLKDAVREGMAAEDFDARGISRARGRLEIGRFAAVGGNETFFSSMEARNVRCKMGLVDGLLGVWEPGIVTISRLDLDLRAGAEDEEAAAKIAEAVFHKSSKVEVNSFEIADATIRWGYSEPTRGGIENSALSVQRTPTGWRMVFKGGTFYQNWLHDLDIVALTVLCEPSGILFEKAEFKSGAASVEFPSLRVSGNATPEVKGSAKIRNLPLDKILPSAASDFLEGTISGDFRLFGSTNTSDGVGFSGEVVLDGTDVITLRERIHLLKALSVVDGVRNYKRVDFREGTFDLKTSGGGMAVTNVDLKSEDLFSLTGAMLVRLPTEEEKSQAMTQAGVGGGWIGGDEGASEFGPWGRSGLTLRDAATAKAANSDEVSLFDKLDLAADNRILGLQAAERLSRMLRYEGKFRISIPGDAFDGAAELVRLHPRDPATGRILLDVPIEGFLYELTLKQAEDLYQQGQR